MAYLLEETKGILPLWLSPIQINIIPVNNEFHLSYCKELYKTLFDKNIRVKLDDRDEKLGYKIRESVTKKIPYALIIGDKEKDNKNITYRKYGSEESITVSLLEFIDIIEKEIQNKL